MSVSSRHSRAGGNPEKLKQTTARDGGSVDHAGAIIDHIDIWTNAIKPKSSAGRGGSNGKYELYGIKKLRQLILELAVRGLLVPQDPNDEPASVLLKKIAAEKVKLIKEGEIKKQISLPEIVEDEKYCVLPGSWEWSRLGEVTNYGATDKAEPGDVTENTWVLELEDVEKETSRLLQKTRYSEKQFQSSKNRFKENDVIYGKLRPYLDKVIVADEAGVCTTEMIPVRGYLSLSPFYLRLIMKSPHFVKYADDSTHGMNLPRLGTDKARMALFPLAPYDEQHRIVAKVDGLMALCDQLEQQTETSISGHQTLVKTVLEALIARDGVFTGNAGTISGKQSPTTKTDAQTIFFEHFDTLFTTEWSIDQLKQTFLQLAVMGKLVPQNPNDEPASELLKKIAKEKEKLIKEKKIKKENPLPPVSDEEKPFDLPNGWALERVGNLTEKLGSGSTPRGGKTAYVEKGYPFLRSQNVWNDGLKLDDIAYIPKETHDKMENTKVYPGDVLLNITGASLGRSTIFPKELKEANVSQHVTIIRLIEQDMGRFVHLGILSPMIQKLVWGRQVGMAIEGLSKKVLEMFEFPIPPIEEQHRIVAKVDELMALCDQLKQRLTDTKTTQLHLADAIVEQAIE